MKNPETSFKFYVQMDDGKTSYPISEEDFNNLNKEIENKSKETYEIMPVVIGDILKEESFLNTRIIVISKILSLTKQSKIVSLEQILTYQQIMDFVDEFLEVQDEYIKWDFEEARNKLVLSIDDELTNSTDNCFFNFPGVSKSYLENCLNEIIENLNKKREKLN